MDEHPRPGAIAWHDLTVPDAERVRDFYAAVAGWQPEPVDMAGYADFNMLAAGSPTAGICHARGVNADLPAQWLMYIVVKDLEASLASVARLGGQVLAGPMGPGGPGGAGGATYAVIRDPAGAVCALYQPAA